MPDQALINVDTIKGLLYALAAVGTALGGYKAKSLKKWNGEERRNGSGSENTSKRRVIMSSEARDSVLKIYEEMDKLDAKKVDVKMFEILHQTTREDIEEIKTDIKGIEKKLEDLPNKIYQQFYGKNGPK